MKKKVSLILIVVTLGLIAFGIISVLAETVNVSTVSSLQSAHNYSNNMDKTWVYTHSVSCDSLKVTFSSDTKTETKYDFIYILDGNNNQIGKYDGTSLAGTTITVPGNIVKIRLTSDVSQTYYGFRVTSIEGVVSNTGTVNVSTVDELQSSHTYADNTDKTWIYTHSSDIESLDITFSDDTKTEVENDFIYIMDANDNLIGKYDGSSLAGKTINIPGKVVKIRLTSNENINEYGFKVTAIEEIGPIYNLSASGISKSSVKFTFSAPVKATLVEVEYSTDEINWNKATTTEPLTAESTQATVTSLEFGVKYWFRLNITGGSREGISNIITYAIEYNPESDFEFSNGTITKYIGTGSFVCIPEKIGGTVVTSIGDSAFYNCTDLTDVIIPDSVTTIENSTFYNCTGVTNITIPDSVTSIGNNAFYGCTGLISITIGKNVKSIGSSAFYNCTNLTQIIWNAKNVADFSYNSRIFDNAGIDNEGINVVFGDEVESIPEYCFYSWSGYEPNITSVSIGKNVRSIGGCAFDGCTGLISITIPDSVTGIGDYAFYKCTNLKEIHWNAKNVADFSSSNYIFYNAGIDNEGITVVFGDEVERIPAYCFYPESGYEPKIASVTIGKNVTSIGEGAFRYCAGLTEVNIKDLDAWCSIDFGNYPSNPSNPLYYAKNLLVNGTLVTELNIPSGVTGISNYAFYGCSSLTSITIPDSVTSIGNYAFFDCTGLTSVTIGKNVTSIGDYAFYNCTNLTQVNWNAKNVSDFSSGNNIFYNAGKDNDGITVIFGDEVESIPAYCFYTSSEDGTNITSITLGKSVTSIGGYAFYDCTNLTEINWNTKNVADFSSGNKIFYNAGKDNEGITVVFGDEVERIPANCFYPSDSSGHEPKITSVTIGKNVTSIGYSAFDNCTNLNKIDWNAKNIADFSSRNYIFYDAGKNNEGINVIFGDEVERIPANCFYPSDFSGHEPKITSVTIGKNVTSIGIYAFYNCTGLTSITIPENVTSIGYYAFYNCTGLTSITIPDSVTSIGTATFSTCTGLTSVTIGKNVTSIGRYAFYNCKNLTEINWNAKNVADFSSGNWIFYNAGIDNEGINVVFGDDVERIPEYCFYPESGYEPKIASVKIGEKVREIGNYAFYNSTYLTDITLNTGITSIGADAFTNTGYVNDSGNWDGELLYCDNYLIGAKNTIEIASIKAGILAMKDGIFRDCTELLRVTLPESLISIPKDAFYGCSNLLKVTIPENVSSIGSYAFYNCNNITKINIPSNVKKIGNYAFSNCSSLEGVYITDISSWIKIEFESDDDWYSPQANPLYSAGKLYVNNELAENIVITDNITKLNDGLFAGCTSIKSVTLPETLTSIGTYAFYNCSSLTSINIPTSVTSIGNSAFSYCHNLENVYIKDLEAWCKLPFNEYGQNPLSNGADLYLNGELLKDLVIPEEITVLNNYTFGNFNKLRSIILHDNIEKIEENVFNNCYNLKYVVIPENILYIKKNSFVGCDNLKYVLFKGSQSTWDDMLIYSGNDPLNNATVVCNAKEKTYKFVTSSNSQLSDITAYCIADAPTVKDDVKSLIGWYDNPEFLGNKIEFPYCGDVTTLYALLADRTGTDYDTAYYVQENKKYNYDVKSWVVKYFEIIPDYTGTYTIHLSVVPNPSINVTDENHYTIFHDSNGGEYTLNMSFTAGSKYYIWVNTNKPFSLSVENDIYPHTSTEVSADGMSFTVNVSGIASGKTVVLALYNGEELVEMQSVVYTGGAIPFTTTKTYTNAKVMVWDDLDSLKPVCDTEIVK